MFVELAIRYPARFDTYMIVVVDAMAPCLLRTDNRVEIIVRT